jgi:hypothetical protein
MLFALSKFGGGFSLISFFLKIRNYLKSAGADLHVERDKHRVFYLNKKLGAHLFQLISYKPFSSRVYFVELELVGLGYRVSLKKGRIRLGLGCSHVIYLLVPKGVFILKKKYRILVYSLDRFSLGSFVASLLKFKKLNPYKLKGLKKRHLLYKLKPGKRSK